MLEFREPVQADVELCLWPWIENCQAVSAVVHLAADLCQRTQYPLIKEYTLKHNIQAPII